MNPVLRQQEPSRQSLLDFVGSIAGAVLGQLVQERHGVLRMLQRQEPAKSVSNSSARDRSKCIERLAAWMRGLSGLKGATNLLTFQLEWSSVTLTDKTGVTDEPRVRSPGGGARD